MRKKNFQAALGSCLGLALAVFMIICISGPPAAAAPSGELVVLVDTLYFAFRFGWVGRKIAAGRIGPIPGPPLPLAILGLAPLGGFVTLWLVVLLVIGGVFP